jgi:hypothetical protein
VLLVEFVEQADKLKAVMAINAINKNLVFFIFL